MQPVKIGVFPGSFNPPTHAHLRIALAALDLLGVDQVLLCVSRAALAKDNTVGPKFEQRLQVVKAMVAAHPQLDVITTDAKLLADICTEVGAAALIVGADKWRQIHELQWYESAETRDRLLASLPRTIVAARSGYLLQPAVPQTNVLVVDDILQTYSSTAARTTNPEWMVDEAADHVRAHGGWH